MLESFSGNAIAAKARAIYGKRLTTANYNDLLRLSSVSDVCAYLKSSTNYGVYMKGVNETSIHRGQLEDIIRHSRIEKYFSLCHYDFTRNKGFYSYVISSIEVQLILKAIMLLNSNTPRDIITVIPPSLQEYATFDFKLLTKVECFSDLLDVLKRTPYYLPIKNFDAPNGDIGFSDCEHALKTQYYQNILNDIEKNYKGKIKAQLKEIVLIEIELLNLSLIYRLKRYFKKSPEQIKSLLLPFYYKINKHSLEGLLEDQTKQEFIKKMRLAVYSSNMTSIEFNYIEDYTKRLRYILNRKIIRFSTNAPISFFSLMTLLQIEIENIIIIIESIRYDALDSPIKKLLILE